MENLLEFDRTKIRYDFCLRSVRYDRTKLRCSLVKFRDECAHCVNDMGDMVEAIACDV